MSALSSSRFAFSRQQVQPEPTPPPPPAATLVASSQKIDVSAPLLVMFPKKEVGPNNNHVVRPYAQQDPSQRWLNSGVILRSCVCNRPLCSALCLYFLDRDEEDPKATSHSPSSKILKAKKKSKQDLEELKDTKKKLLPSNDKDDSELLECNKTSDASERCAAPKSVSCKKKNKKEKRNSVKSLRDNYELSETLLNDIHHSSSLEKEETSEHDSISETIKKSRGNSEKTKKAQEKKTNTKEINLQQPLDPTEKESLSGSLVQKENALTLTVSEKAKQSQEGERSGKEGNNLEEEHNPTEGSSVSSFFDESIPNEQESVIESTVESDTKTKVSRSSSDKSTASRSSSDKDCTTTKNKKSFVLGKSARQKSEKSFFAEVVETADTREETKMMGKKHFGGRGHAPEHEKTPKSSRHASFKIASEEYAPEHEKSPSVTRHASFKIASRQYAPEHEKTPKFTRHASFKIPSDPKVKCTP